MQKKGLLPRRAAWEVLQAVSAGAYADIALDRIIKKYSLKGVDRSFMTELAYGSIRYMYFLDHWIDNFGKIPAKKQQPLLRLILHLGLYQILKMDRVPTSAAINTTVEIIKNSELNGLTSFVNGFLRAVSRFVAEGKTLQLNQKLSENLSLHHSLPLWLIEELIDWYGEEVAEDIAKASNQVPSFDLRVNRLCSTPVRLQNEFKLVGIESDLIDDSPNGLEIKLGLGDLCNWPGYESGKWCVQDRSSQWVTPLLSPKPGDRILDACSAPGSKTTQLAELIANEGEIWAVDRSLSRLNLVSINSLRLGATCINLLKADASTLLSIKPEWKKYFQCILIDAPCSGLGTLARHPDARWRMNPNKVKELIELQGKLLEGIFPLLSSGGRLVYSTCTINPFENSHQISRFLSKHHGIRLIQQQQILPQFEKAGDGFYAAVLELA